MAASCGYGRTRCPLPNGKTGTREVVEHPGGVGILALDDDGCVVLVRAVPLRALPCADGDPGGEAGKGEAPFVTAQRELKEEIGAEAEEWTDLGALIASPGCYGETLYLFLARGLHFGETHPDEDEFLDVLRVPFDRAVAQCLDGTLTDAKTVAAILKAKILLER